MCKPTYLGIVLSCSAHSFNDWAFPWATVQNKETRPLPRHRARCPDYITAFALLKRMREHEGDGRGTVRGMERRCALLLCVGMYRNTFFDLASYGILGLQRVYFARTYTIHPIFVKLNSPSRNESSFSFI